MRLDTLFPRELDLKKIGESAFLFGPRMTGKTTLIESLPAAARFNFLDPEEELEFRVNPRRFWESLQAVPRGSLVTVDEIQRIPEILDFVQMGIDRLKLQFILTGSSARKLRRGGANLLGGRALDLRLHALGVREMGEVFRLDDALSLGTLPKVAKFLARDDRETARRYISGYSTIYIKEEIQAEALTRHLGAFQRFLPVAAAANGQIIEYADVSRECSVPASTVKEYFQIIEDTLIGDFIWPHRRNERKKARPKFYFFDCGIVRSLQHRLNDPPTSSERGFLFETWFIHELMRIRDYAFKPHTFTHWRQRQHEIDFLVEKGGKVVAGIECKAGQAEFSRSAVAAFRAEFPGIPLVVASAIDKRPRIVDGVRILPWRDALEWYSDLGGRG